MPPLAYTYGPINWTVQSYADGISSVTDVLSDTATLEFSARDGFIKNRTIFFELKSPTFLFGAYFAENRVWIRRNEHHQHSELATNPDGDYHVAFQWEPDVIACGIREIQGASQDSAGTMNARMRAKRTPIAQGRQELIVTLRKEGVLPTAPFASVQQLQAAVIDALSFVERDIRRYGTERLIWVRDDSGNLRPRPEPDMSRLVASYLATQGMAKGFDIHCDESVGVGRTDFLVSAPIKDVGTCRIVIEGKRADSDKLVDGLQKQLPEYMKRVGTENALYMVYWLRCPEHDLPAEFSSAGALVAARLHHLRFPPGVRVVTLDLSLQPNPSTL